MRRRFFSAILAFLLITQCVLPVYAHSKEGPGGHDQTMSLVLFGSATYKSTNLSGKPYKYLTALEDAVAICADQFNGNYSEELQYLNDMNIHGIPSSIDEIDFSYNSHHRRYTHMGWSHSYTIDKGNWSVRKTILLQTVNKVFGFQMFAGEWSAFGQSIDLEYDEQCEAFAELLYYIHILGDIPDSGMDEGYSDMCKLAVANPNEGNEDIYWELEKILPVIFASQTSSESYCGLMADIKLQASEARAFVAGTSDLKSNYSTYQQYASDLLEKLESKLPGLFKEEEFFKDIFYK